MCNETYQHPVKKPKQLDQITIKQMLRSNCESYAIIKNPSEKTKQIFAKMYPSVAWVLINNPSEAVKHTMVRHDGVLIRYFKNPSLTMQLAAVRQNGFAIGWIKNPCHQVQRAAFDQDPQSIQMFPCVSPKLRAHVTKTRPDLVYMIPKHPIHLS